MPYDLEHIRDWWHLHPGMLSWPEAEALWRLAHNDSAVRHRSIRILEIGCWKGLSTGIFRYAQPKQLITVDPFVGVGPRDGHPEESGKELQQRYGANTVDAPPVVDGKHFLISHTNAIGEVRRYLDEWLINLLFVDELHTTEAVQKDVDDYLPLIAFGGYAAFHDCRLDSVKAVTMRIPFDWPFEHVRTVDNLVWFRRVK